MGWDEKCAALRSLVDQFQLQLNDIVPSVLLRHVSRALPDTFCDRAAVALDAGSPAVSHDSPPHLGIDFRFAHVLRAVCDLSADRLGHPLVRSLN